MGGNATHEPRNRKERRAAAALARSGEVFNREKFYLKAPAAAEYLGVSTSWLNKSRVYGTGPAFSRLGRSIIYAVADLDAFAASRRVRSTSEVA